LGLAALAAMIAILPLAPAALSSPAARSLQLGIFDDAHILGGDPATVFPLLTALHARMIRLTLWWGGPNGVATARPASPSDPGDPAYSWGRYDRVVRAARDYARICNAVVNGVKSDPVARPLVACGVTAPRGNNEAGSARASVSPLVFLRAMRSAGARGFDAYAHNPYYGSPVETPST